MATNCLLLLVLATLLYISNTEETDIDIYSCPRIHKAWHLTTEKEKQLFIGGLHRINQQGKLSHFSATHHHIVDSMQAHFTSEFFPWHRYFIWEFENQVRSLGDEYKCFAVPYWDMTVDAGEYMDANILHSGLGGAGDVSNDDCVDILADGSWSRNNFPLSHICHIDDELDNIEDGCCLKRAAAESDISAITSYTRFIKAKNNYGAFGGFRQTTFQAFHGEAHMFIGGTFANYTHMISRYSPDDPTFWLLHTWFDYQFAVWKNCWGYHLIDAADLDNYPKAYFPWPDSDTTATKNGVPESGLDTKLYFVPMEDIKWWQGSSMNPTARKLWKEADWDFLFERGTFIRNSKLTSLCSNDWDTSIILENSAETKAKIHEQSQTEVETYVENTWTYLTDMMHSAKYNDIFNEIDYLQTWDAKSCNYQRQKMEKEPCYIPQDYEKCSEDDIERESEITIDELLNKDGVKDNVCLEEIRYNFYAYAKSMNMLYSLCMGEFDQYNYCETPNIDFMIDLDDDEYYNKLRQNKQKMKEESIAILIKKENENGNKEKISVHDGVDISIDSIQYPKFDVLGYIVIAFVFGGIAFMTTIRHCYTQINAKLTHPNNIKRRKNKITTYGAV